MRLPRRVWAAVPGGLAVIAIVMAGCGGGGSDASAPPDLSKVATATLPAELPEPILIGQGNVSTGGGPTYTVQSGDTLAGIAERFNVSLDDLLTANPGLNPAQLSVGDVVRLPEGVDANAPTPAPEPEVESTPTEEPPPPEPTSTPPPAPSPTPSSLGQTYVVQSGDIPETIAAQFGITTEALLAANPGANPNNLQVGQVLIIPPSAPPPEGE